jgi:DNA-binding NtrC family response regulator
MCSTKIQIRDEALRRLVHSSLATSISTVAGQPDVLVVELTGESNCAGASAVASYRRENPQIRVVAVARESRGVIARAAVRLHVDDFLVEPFSASELRFAVGAQVRQRNAPSSVGAAPLLGTSEPITRIRRYIERVALADSSVLIAGETGTGKDLVAALIHASGPRRARPFIQVNVAAIPDSLFESELFGYERGSFTGAHASYPGKLRLANGGTVLLDEIGDMSTAAQTKLLRAIEAQEVTPIGGYRPVPIDVRVIAATNRDLDDMSRSGSFRLDLLFRLNVIRINMPPLRDRLDDIPTLLAHFVEVFNRRFRRDLSGFRDDAVARLKAYSWPGNIRELRNVVEVVFVHAGETEITPADLPTLFQDRCPDAVPERRRLVDALAANHWNVSRAAGALKCSRMTVYRKMAHYGVARSTSA